MSAWPRVVVFSLLVWLGACGADGDPGDGQARPTSSADTSTPSPEEPGFLGYEYKPVDPATCDGTLRLGGKTRIAIEAPDTVGTTIFRPACVTDVSAEEVVITLNNTSTNLHNVIVEGNDHELVAGAGESSSATFALAPDDDQIGFQCTIHDRMYGAFFR